MEAQRYVFLCLRAQLGEESDVYSKDSSNQKSLSFNVQSLHIQSKVHTHNTSCKAITHQVL